MAGGFTEDFAGSMGWKAEKGTAYGIYLGYLFTVRSYGGVTYTNVRLYKQGSLNTIKLGEWYSQARSKYKIAQTPHSNLSGIEIVQHFASPAEVKGMIEAFAEWLTAEGARSGCAKCGRMDACALTITDETTNYQCPARGRMDESVPAATGGIPNYQYPEYGGGTKLGFEPGVPSETSEAESINYEDGPEGIGGWLVLFVIGRFLGILISFIGIISIITGHSAQILISAGYGYIITLATLLFVISIGFEISIITLLFRKRILFRTLFVIYSAFNLAIAISIPLVINSYFGVEYAMNASTIGSIGGTIIWTIYLFVSQRVKNTFTRFEKKGKKADGHDFGTGAPHRDQPFSN